ncbi:phage recombination protein Bet [Haemophilus parainfluenzae]|jgi:phage recombination protein bet|uniref:phage recombination protein Bet n=1 Tax=Haemophilus parainfluenzae TaxID=729 RepID=UPI000DAEDE1C|nr:phage recombination protein Bet [Haemophilus parainfluenzae]RDE78328.1 phage recombination protein Bet [Haemophilus parainfluenzae]DAX78722.1 MAG TPA: recombination protein [Caudoviricetes sp.]
MNTLPANIQTALTERNIDTAVWTTLQNSVFPGAKDESILLAVDYCKARKLDILKKPCHIVPMQVTLSGQKDNNGNDRKIWRDVIMPGIYEQRITAFRTGQMAGQDEPVFGNTVAFKGIEAPEWCRVTVYRFINGERCAFSHTEYFSEACATTRDGLLNSMWRKRPRGQLAKCAEAGALRKAFPDELGGVITADEVNEEPINQHSATTPDNGTTVIDTQSVELITPEQIKEIENLVEVTGSNLAGLLAAAGNVPSIEKITKSNAEHAINRLLSKLNEQQAKDERNDKDIPL